MSAIESLLSRLEEKMIPADEVGQETNLEHLIIYTGFSLKSRPGSSSRP